jgi:hypothetical protein
MSDGMRGAWLSAGERRRGGFRFRSLHAALLAAVSVASLGQTRPERLAGNSTLKGILTYIQTAWDSLTRSTTSCGGVADSKLLAAPVVYLPTGFDQPRELDQMQRDCAVKVAHLPQVIHQLGTTDVEWIQPPGFEKYNVVSRSSETRVKAGYTANIVGFGWTNATFVELLRLLPPEKVNRMADAIQPATASQ